MVDTKKLPPLIQENMIPNLSAAAYYNPFSQMITFNDISKREYEAILADPNHIHWLEKTKIIIHECCHFVDHLTTLRGQQALAAAYNAINARSSNDEHEFYKMIQYIQLINSFKLADYYKTIVPGNYSHEYGKWRFEATCGVRFDSNGKIDEKKPIVFLRFNYRDGNQRKDIARIPLSTEALWETSAMAEEMKFHLFSILRLNEEQLEVEAQLWRRNLLNELYHPDLLTYSVAAHHVSSLTLGEPFFTFILSKILSRISLNLPIKYCREMKIPPNSPLRQYPTRLRGYYESGEPSLTFHLLNENLKRELRQNDHVFLHLLKNKHDQLKLDEIEFDINKILELCGLPRKETLEADIIDEIEALHVTDGPYYEEYAKYKHLGIKLLKEIGIEGPQANPTYYIDAIKKYGLVAFQEDNALDIEERYFNYWDLENQILEFSKACGY